MEYVIYKIYWMTFLSLP